MFQPDRESESSVAVVSRFWYTAHVTTNEGAASGERCERGERG